MTHNPPAPLPDPVDRAAAVDVSQRYQIPLSTVYGLMNGGLLPSWKIGRKKRCTSWPAVRAFFGDVGAPRVGA